MMNEEEAARLRELEQENGLLREKVEAREAFIANHMAAYLPQDVLDEILDGRQTMEPQQKDVTIFFSDIRSSTALSEKMILSDYMRLINHFLEEMIDIVNAWQGTILSFMGDSIITVFGAPRRNPTAARDAVACAVAMQRLMPQVNVWNVDNGYPVISMGIGIHTGQAILGNIGSTVRMKYDMIGRDVSLASRIESYTEGGQILISSETLAEVADQVILNPAGSMIIQPKGIQGDIRVHDVVGFGSYRTPRAEALTSQK